MARRKTAQRMTAGMAGFSQTWRDDAEVIYQYLRRDMTDAYNERIRVYPDTGEGHIQRTVALTYRLSRELSTLYLRPCLRQWVGLSPSELVVMEAEYQAKKVNRRLRTAQEQQSVLANATIWVWPNGTSDRDYKLIVPPIHTQWITPKGLLAQEVEDIAEWRVLFPIPSERGCEYAMALVTPTKAVWESGPKDWVGKGIWMADGSNPFGRIPVTLIRSMDPAPGEFLSPIPQDIRDAQRAVNHDHTDVGEVRRKQGFGQAYCEGVSPAEAKKIKVGPEKVVGLPAGAKFGFASANPDLAGSVESIRAYSEMVIATNGMNPATVMKSAGITALAKIIEIQDREVERIRSVDEFAAAEQDLAELIALALKHRNGGKAVITSPFTVKVTHREPIQPADPTSAAQAATQDIGNNLETAATILAERKGMSIDDAEKRVLANAEFNAKLKASSSAPRQSSPPGLTDPDPDPETTDDVEMEGDA